MKILIWFVSLIFFTIFVLVRKVTEFLSYVQTSADWYAERKIFPWEPKKARAQYDKEYNEAVKEQLKNMTGNIGEDDDRTSRR